MEAVVLVVVLLIAAALALSFSPARRRRTVHVERDVAVRRVVEQPVVQTHVVRTQPPVVEEVVEERY